MNKFLMGLLALSSISSFAGTNETKSFNEILADQTCYINVVNRPIDFNKGEAFTNTGRVYIQAKFLSVPSINTVRRLAVGRSLTVSGIESGIRERILVKDKSIYSFCVDIIPGNDNCEDPGKLTLAQIEEYSDFNLKISCTKDDVVLF